MTNQAQSSRHWGEIDGVSIDFPMVVQEMNSATLTWSVPLDAAAAVLPGDAFEPADMGGSAMLILALVDYLQNPWGDYLEVNFGLLVQPKGRPEEVGAFQWRMPVDQEFTCAAGRQVMGVPKTVEDITFTYDGEPGDPDATVTMRLVMADEPSGSATLQVRFPRPSSEGVDASLEPAMTYAYLDGVPMELGLDMELPPLLLDPAAVEVTLGEGALADELRTLGLPERPADLVMWGENLAATFQVPRPVSGS